MFFHTLSYRRAVKKADKMRSKTFKKFFVISVKGNFKAVSKQRMKELYKNGAFKKGLNFREIEKRVLYTTK